MAKNAAAPGRTGQVNDSADGWICDLTVPNGLPYLPMPRASCYLRGVDCKSDCNCSRCHLQNKRIVTVSQTEYTDAVIGCAWSSKNTPYDGRIRKP